MFEWLIDLIMKNKYLTAAAIFIIFYVISEIVVIIFEKVLLKLARKTKTEVDDVLIQRTNKPISFLLFSIGLKLALMSLNFEGKIAYVANGIVYSLLVITAVYIGYVVLDVLIKYWGIKFAEKTKSTVDDHLFALFHKFLKVMLYVAILLLVLKVWGIQIGPLLAGLGIAGIAIAFALQGTLGNIFGGISMILDKNISVGEVIVLDATTKGKVEDIGLRSTKIRSFDNDYIIVPNSELASKKLQNITKPDPSVRVVIPFGVAYGSDIAKVKNVVLKEIEKIEGKIEDEKKAPSVRFLEMGDSALLFKAYFWMKDYTERFRAIDEANTFIYNALNKNKITIPFPQMDVHLKKR